MCKQCVPLTLFRSLSLSLSLSHYLSLSLTLSQQHVLMRDRCHAAEALWLSFSRCWRLDKSCSSVVRDAAGLVVFLGTMAVVPQVLSTESWPPGGGFGTRVGTGPCWRSCLRSVRCPGLRFYWRHKPECFCSVKKNDCSLPYWPGAFVCVCVCWWSSREVAASQGGHG